jgi:hypothetical protein
VKKTRQNKNLEPVLIPSEPEKLWTRARGFEGPRQRKVGTRFFLCDKRGTRLRGDHAQARDEIVI